MAITEARPELTPAPPADAPRRTWRRRLGIIAPGSLIALMFLVCFAGPLVLPLPPATGGDVLDAYLPSFSPGHFFGTDPNGNDIFARVLAGGQNSLIVAVATNVLGLTIGGTLGAFSAYAGRASDMAIMRVLDVLIAFPSIVLILAVSQSLGPSRTNTILALSFFSIPAFARISRAATLSLAELPFMQAARLCGTPWWRVLFRHVAPNITPQLTTFSMLGMGLLIILEGALSFLGLGLQPPTPTWGNMISQGQQSLAATPALVIWPSLFLFLSVLAFNLLGESLRARWSSR